MNGNQGGGEADGIGVEAHSRAENFLQLIQQLLLLIKDIPTEEITLALPESGDDQLKSWYNAMFDVLKRCEMMVSGPFMSLLSSHLSEHASRKAATELMGQVQDTLACCFGLMSDYEPTLHERIKKRITSSTGTVRNEYESIVDNEARVQRLRGRLCRLAIYPRNHLEDSIRKMVHDLVIFSEGHGESVYLQVEDGFRRDIAEGTEVAFPCRTVRQISLRLEQMRFAGVVPSHRETRALTIDNVEGLKQWFYVMEDVVAEFDLLTKLLPLKFEQKYESAKLDKIKQVTMEIQGIVAPHAEWASRHQDAIYPRMADNVTRVLNTIPDDGLDEVETYEYERVIRDENEVQTGLASLLNAPLAVYRRLRGALREVTQIIAEFHKENLDLMSLAPLSKRRRTEPGADGPRNINPYAQYD
ncbi:hypothetical protein ACHAWO_003296 [Cyclotella atomus]|uniref:Uncharacterized protein n=1 Tax=Cyclotella atomus TaxID=382360 RepID=A0ABD3Q7H1_9STRA